MERDKEIMFMLLIVLIIMSVITYRAMACSNFRWTVCDSAGKCENGEGTKNDLIEVFRGVIADEKNIRYDCVGLKLMKNHRLNKRGTKNVMGLPVK